MNREEYIKLVRESLERRLGISEKKGADYANEDVLSSAHITDSSVMDEASSICLFITDGHT